MSISYAHIAAGSKVEPTDGAAFTASQEPFTINKASKEQSEIQTEEQTNSVATQSSAAQESSSNRADSAEKESSTISGSKADKAAKKPQLNLAPAPVPVVSAWGKKASSAASAAIDHHDQSKWPSPLHAIADEPSYNKKPIAKNTGKEKWVPYEASVVISSSSNGKPKPHNKRSGRKKASSNAATGNSSASSGVPAANGAKNGKAIVKSVKRKVADKKEESKLSEKKETESDNTAAAYEFSDAKKSIKSEDVAKNVSEDADANVESLKKDHDSPKHNGADFRQNGNRETHHSHHYNNGNGNAGFHHTKNARYIRANYNPYKGKPHSGHKHYYNHNNNHAATTNGEFKHGSGTPHNSNGFVPFKQQQIPFIPGFIPQSNFKHQPPPYLPQFYSPYNGNYYGGDMNGVPLSVPKVGGKNFNQQRYFNNGAEFVPGASPVISSPDQQLNAIINQVCYYFSVENLVKDFFLRKQMNSEGFIPISVIANFYRVQTLSGKDYNLVAEAIEKINFLEVQEEKVRLLNGYQQWVLPVTERDENGKDESVTQEEGSEKQLSKTIESLEASN